ncbi:MAG: hypothetical protein KBD64_08145, partial [Gammaproteobacteria bacterium]|nr:hypothetical protein [Gammaproteobacteria bacterium]
MSVNSYSAGIVKKLKNKLKLSPTGVVCASLTMIIGVLLGQAIGVFASLNYVLLFTIFGGAIFAVIGYFVNRNWTNNVETFFRSVAVVLGIALGGLWGGAAIGPFLFLLASFIPINLMLLCCIAFGSAFAGLIVFTVLKLTGSKSPKAFMTLAGGFMFMIIGACLGIPFGPLGWFVGVNLGLVAGLILGGVLNNNKSLYHNSTTGKVLANLFAISGLLTGVMIGTLVNTLLFSSSLIWCSATFGIIFMLFTGAVGLKIGQKIERASKDKVFSLENPKLRHKLYQIALLIPTIFMGYLTGGLAGFYWFPYSEIILGQAFGTVIASSLYVLTVNAYYKINKFISYCKQKYSLESTTPAPARSPDSAAVPVLKPSLVFDTTAAPIASI